MDSLFAIHHTPVELVKTYDSQSWQDHTELGALVCRERTKITVSFVGGK